MGIYDYPHQFEAETEIMLDGAGFVGVFLVIYLLILLVAFAFSIGLYILQGLGLYTIAERRGIKRSWLSWIPFGNLWILGSISDQYRYVVKGKIKNRRKLLLGLNIGTVVLSLGWFIGLIVVSVMATVSGDVLGLGLIAAIGSILLIVLYIVFMVCYFVSLYDLYRSCSPDNGALYLILSVLVSWLVPLLVFVCRKQDGGMPPRKQPAPQQVVVPTVEVVVDPDVVETVVVPTVEPVSEDDFAQPEESEDESC